MFGRGDPVTITPAEFEQQAHDWLRAVAKELKCFTVQRLQVLEGDSGEYEIDVLAEFVIFGGAVIRCLIECKRYTHPVKRDVVMVLESKIRDSNAHKGIIFSTSGFQSGAIEYAQKRGIATIEVKDGKASYKTKSDDKTPVPPPPWVKFSRFIGWFLSINDEGQLAGSLIEDDRLQPLTRWFDEMLLPEALTKSQQE